MDEQPTLREIYLDLLSNQPKDEIGRQNAANRLTQEFEQRLEASIERSWHLPPIVVIPEGEYLELLLEARKLYVDGHFYSCVAMCGIVNERLIKDVIRASIWIEKDGIVEKAASSVLDKLERVDASTLSEFTRGAGLITEEAFKATKKLVELRNKYAHARGSQPESEALDAIKHLHQVVEGTVSIFKDHEIKDGKFVRKNVDAA